MVISIIRLAMVLAVGSLIACSQRGAPGREDLYSNAMRAYDGGSDIEALTSLSRLAESDDADDALLANAILADIYLTRAYLNHDISDARKSLQFNEKVGKSPRPDLQAYRNYQRAVALDVLGKHQDAEQLLSLNCQGKGSTAECALIPEFSDNLPLSPRYQFDAIYVITSLLIDRKYGSDAVLAANISALVRRDYRKAEAAVSSLREKGAVPEIVEYEYCMTLHSVPSASADDVSRCDLRRPKNGP
ncbi:hypothetical protein MNR01_06480 [Lysobacter sp. S4-A87]|uniref:hypothetical protein n=1 Tax=Lysobacter sp. S4-A87 TaxID=2925843 RepID=UPI001F53336B|nr:hypothetical protein [Lysobacter sp. S4-A87]UNK50647.1 hypothetical protein MNR01_06480 [Lysobacter sp. S4-A87]